jgi:hypothetical protein
LVKSFSVALKLEYPVLQTVVLVIALGAKFAGQFASAFIE